VKEAGLATHFIPSASLPDVEVELRRQGAYMRDAAAVDRTLSAFEVCHRHRAHSAWVSSSKVSKVHGNNNLHTTTHPWLSMKHSGCLRNIERQPCCLHSCLTAALCPCSQAAPDAASDVLDHRQDMDACFAGDSMEGIYAALQQHGSSWAEATLKQLQG
jgi:hypothetical protein